jgi:hypothetical protein
VTPEEAAAELDANQYGNEGSKDLFARMKAAGLVAVFGASDDLMEFRGAIYDEAGCYDGGTVYVNSIFADLEAAFPGYLFELTQDFRVIVAKATNPQSPSEERSDTDSAEQPGSGLTQKSGLGDSE